MTDKSAAAEASYGGPRIDLSNPLGEEWDGTDAKREPQTKMEYSPLSVGFTDEMFAWCMQELRDKAKIYDDCHIVSVFDGAGAVFKSDHRVSAEVAQRLKAAVAPLEDVPEADKDWHPGSDGKVLDLVHPSMWPVVYGRTRVLQDRKIGLNDCLEAIGGGQVAPAPKRDMPPGIDKGLAEEIEKGISKLLTMEFGFLELFSIKYQWLPAEVEISDGRPRFTTYINNVHPVEQADIYPVIEEILAAALPMLQAAYDRVMTWPAWPAAFDVQADKTRADIGVSALSRTRLPYQESKYDCATPAVCGGVHTNFYDQFRNRIYDEDDDDVVFPYDQWLEVHPTVQPQPREPYEFVGVRDYRPAGPYFTQDAGETTSNIQVIVKLANIHLTPEKPTYDGGSWHLEGMRNERICATALYYYDCENITDSRLGFRTVTDAEGMDENFTYVRYHHSAFADVYGADPDHWSSKRHKWMQLGDVVTRQGRLLVFPNVFEHRVSPFELVDKSKPGHRKIVAIFLVDPAQPILSSATVPPQQLHWRKDTAVNKRLPRELANIIHEQVHCPYGRAEAEAIRADLMEERTSWRDGNWWGRG